MSKPRRELQVLGNFYRDPAVEGVQAAGTWWRPSPSKANLGELDSHEVAEVVQAIILPPVNPDGTPDLLQRVQLNLDGKLEQYNILNGTDTYLVYADKEHMLFGQVVTFGRPMFAVQNGLDGVLEATCPKYRKSVTVECLAGAGGIDQPYRVILLGYRYRAEELGTALAHLGGAFGGTGTIRDRATGRESDLIAKAPVAIAEETWTQLPGGLDQAVPKVFSFTRFAFNARATTANLPYEFRFKDGFVGSREEDLLFEYDIERRIAIIKGLGVRGVSAAARQNLKEAWWDVGGDERPKSRWPITENVNTRQHNMLHFGKGDPQYPGDFPIYYPIKLLPDPVLISGEKAVLKVVDNGTSVAAGDIVVAVTGTLIELT